MLGRGTDRSTLSPGSSHTLRRARFVLPRVRLQMFVDESYRHATLADRGGDAFDRAQPHIPTGEYTGKTRFEEVRIAAVRPASVLYHVVTREDIPSRIACDLRRQPPGLRVGPDEDEKATTVASGR